ncbi:hypothetical protein [Nannocystis punicea]|uniref:MYXO-CTERM domain-containing protein n=1 Tax=Nannocystis punicea TaxID=2995304 RepID=A0ABY7H7A3_9BACT|nr:hypothetical protein [Nannocystis poenicansa]WAS95142.1 hypothetical protein O0S08_03185 [Nannocystis poenicansa]
MIAATALAVVVATSELHPRTPVTWPEDTPCMTVVDRSKGSVLHLSYSIPFEDTMVSPPPAEVADSRRHQFVAFCRGHSAQRPLPNWLSWTDVAAAQLLAEPPEDVGDAEVLETSGEWAPCFHRITADDARRPITFAAAAEGVDWDTSLVPPGPYVIEGYTWEPVFNRWSSRPGVVHVVDGPGLEVTPAAAVMTRQDYVFAGEPLLLEGCARAMPGSQLRVWWSIADDMELDWQPDAAGSPLIGETFAVSFTPPPETFGQMLALRVDVTDPAQRTFSAHPLQLVAALPPPCERGFLGDCGEDDSGTTTDAETGAGEVTSGPAEPEQSSTDGPQSGSSSTSGASTDGSPMEDSGLGARGCSCEFDAAPAPTTLGLLAVVGLSRRRRRS